MGETSNLELQRKSCRIVIGITGVVDGKVRRFLPNDFNLDAALDTLGSDGYRYYAIIHDKDEGEYKHIHLVLFSTKILRLKQFLNSCVTAFNCDETNVQVRETSNVVKNIQYLIHKNENDKKYKYSKDEIKTNGDLRELNSILGSDENTFDELVSTDGLCDVVIQSQNPTQIINKLGYKFVNNNYRVLTLLITTYHSDWIENRLWR